MELASAQDAVAKRGPCPVAVEVKDAGLEGAQADLVAAAFVAKDVAPATELGRRAVRRLAKTAGTGTAEDEDARDLFAPGVCRKSGFEVVGGVDRRGCFPNSGCDFVQSFFVGSGPCPGHADGNAIGGVKRLRDLAEVGGELAVIE